MIRLAAGLGRWIWKNGVRVWKADPINRYAFNAPTKKYNANYADDWKWTKGVDENGYNVMKPTVARRAVGFAAPLGGLIAADEGIGIIGEQGKGLAKWIKGAEGDPETWRNAADQIREKYVWRH